MKCKVARGDLQGFDLLIVVGTKYHLEFRETVWDSWTTPSFSQLEFKNWVSLDLFLMISFFSSTPCRVLRLNLCIFHLTQPYSVIFISTHDQFYNSISLTHHSSALQHCPPSEVLWTCSNIATELKSRKRIPKESKQSNLF